MVRNSLNHKLINKLMQAEIPERFFLSCQRYEQKINFNCWFSSSKMIVDFYDQGMQYFEDTIQIETNDIYKTIMSYNTNELRQQIDSFKKFDHYIFSNDSFSIKLLEYFISRWYPTGLKCKNHLIRSQFVLFLVGYTENTFILNNPWNWSYEVINKYEFLNSLWDFKEREYFLIPIKRKYFKY